MQVKTSPHLTLRSGQGRLVAGSPEGIQTSLYPGELSSALVPYVQSLNEIEVASYLVEDKPSGSSSANWIAKEGPLALPNVAFALYRGPYQGEPFREGTTNGSVPHTFSDLPDGSYTVVATAWPPAYGGVNQIRPKDPPGGMQTHVTVSGGRPTKLPFLFGASHSIVNGIVTENQTGKGVPGVTLRLASSNAGLGIPLRAQTNASGEYEFPDVAAGTYTLSVLEEKITLAGGKSFEVPIAAQNGLIVSVPDGTTVPGPTIVLQEEFHKIFGTAKSPDGTVLPFLRVEIQDQKGRVLHATQTNQSGYYEVTLQQSGSYLVVPRTDTGLQIPARVNSECHIDILLPGGGAATPHGSFGTPRQAKANEALEADIDTQAYPVLTEEVPSDMMSRSGSSGTSGRSGSGSLGSMAETAIRDVLSWRAKANDPKSFLLALNQSFAAKEVEGHTEFTWTPRTYTVQTDMGAITGAQASIYARAKVALDQSLPLLDGLYALLPALDQQDMDSVRELVRSLFTELVNDFGIEGGPRVPRVDQLFEQLLGSLAVRDTEQAGGTLGLLRDRFGLRREFITTISDEQNLTNYLVLVDYVIGLAGSWTAQKRYFARSGSNGTEPFFGTQLVLLSRSLDVVGQSVKDVYFAMDSVFLGASERQTILLDFSSIGPDSSMYVAEMLEWVDRAVSVELPRQLQDSGKDAIGTMKSVLSTLTRFVRASIVPHQPGKGLPPGYKTPRVQRAMRELAQQLNETFNLAAQVKSPDFPDEAKILAN